MTGRRVGTEPTDETMTLRHRPHRVLYVPADDRPCSVQWPRLLCRLVDWDLVEPPAQLLGWFTQAGDPEEIQAWAVEVAREPLDGAVLSLDMLAYGGLYASRAPGTRTALALSRMEALWRVREAAGDVPIFSFGSIMGLTTLTRSDESARYVDALREFSRKADAEMVLGDQGALDALGADDTGIPDAVLGEYLAIRRRNHEVNRRAIEELARGSLSYLVLAQDEAASEGVHLHEQARLAELAWELGVGDRLVVSGGGPEMGMVLIARAIHAHMNKTPRVRLVYSSPEGARRTPPGEDRPLSEMVAKTVSLLGGEIVETGQADVTALVNCPLSDEADPALDLPSAEDHLRDVANLLGEGERLAGGRGVAVLDVAYREGADDALARGLLSGGQDPARLLAFSAWDRGSGCLGIGLAHAAIRVISLQDKGAFDLAQLIADLTPMRYLGLLDALIESEKAHVTLLFSRLVEDWLYQSGIRRRVQEHIVRLVRGAIVDMRQVHERAESMMSDLLTGAAADLWIEHFLGRPSVDIGMEPHRSSLMLAELEETRLRLPWRRLAEVEVGIEFGVELVAE